MSQLFMILVVALLGGWIGQQLRIPAGVLVGSMVAVSAYNLWGRTVTMPPGMVFAAQMLAGAIIGARVNREILTGLKSLMVPAGIIVISVLIINFVVGFLIYKYSDLDLATSLYAGAPGGATEMTMAAESLGANTPQVAILQLIRLLSVITCLPFILKAIILFWSKNP